MAIYDNSTYRRLSIFDRIYRWQPIVDLLRDIPSHVYSLYIYFRKKKEIKVFWGNFTPL